MLLPLLIFINSAMFVMPAPPKLLIVGYDGLRWDFVTPTLMPNTWNIAKNGVFARQGIKNQVLTVTAATFYTIATGLYEESSGVTGNQMFDPTQQGQDRFYDYWNFGLNNDVAIHSRDARWYKGTPIWLTNQAKGSDRASGSMWWPIGDARVQNQNASKFDSWIIGNDVYEWTYGNLSFWKQNFDKLLGWFTDTNEPINFGMFYAAQPDHYEHGGSIYADFVQGILKDLDDLTGYMIDQIKKAGLDKDMNIIFTADHGMANVYTQYNVIDFDQILDPSTYYWGEKSIFPNVSNGGNATDIYQKLLTYRQNTPQFYVWCKSKAEIAGCLEEIPESFRYKNSDRIGSILVIEYLGYFIYNNHSLSASDLNTPDVFGSHGYLPDEHEMWPYFVAAGPAFKKNYILETVAENVDLYNLMCYILDVDPAPNNGSFDRIRAILADDGSRWETITTMNSSTATMASTKTTMATGTTTVATSTTTVATSTTAIATSISTIPTTTTATSTTTMKTTASSTSSKAITKALPYGFLACMLYLSKVLFH